MLRPRKVHNVFNVAFHLLCARLAVRIQHISLCVKKETLFAMHRNSLFRHLQDFFLAIMFYYTFITIALIRDTLIFLYESSFRRSVQSSSILCVWIRVLKFSELSTCAVSVITGKFTLSEQ